MHLTKCNGTKTMAINNMKKRQTQKSFSTTPEKIKQFSYQFPSSNISATILFTGFIFKIIAIISFRIKILMPIATCYLVSPLSPLIKFNQKCYIEINIIENQTRLSDTNSSIHKKGLNKTCRIVLQEILRDIS